MPNLFLSERQIMTGQSIEIRHKKGHIEELHPWQRPGHGGGGGDGNGGGSEVEVEAAAGLRGMDPLATDGGRGGDASTGSDEATTYLPLHQKSSEERDYGDDPIVLPPGPAPWVATSEAAEDNPAANLIAAGLRDIDQSDPYATLGSHRKYSKEQNYLPPPPPPTPPPTPQVTDSILASLREIHGAGNVDVDNVGTSHAKYSQEQNAVNPDVFPEYWNFPTQSPTKNTPAPAVDVRRVNPAPEADEGDEVVPCRSVDGAYYGAEGGVSARDEGVVVRYRYDVVHELEGGEAEEAKDGSNELVHDLLPKLEEGITEALVPVFFGECAPGGRGRTPSARDGGSLRRRRLDDMVVGIEAKPDDVPLTQQECDPDFVASVPPRPDVLCRRVEGALTLRLPSHRTPAAVVPSATLSILRAIEGGMADGSLEATHRSILGLRMAPESYHLLRPHRGGDAEKDEDGSKGGKAGLIVGAILPLLALGCCCMVGFFLRRRRRKGYVDDEDESVQLARKERRRRRRRSSTSSGNRSAESDTDGEDEGAEDGSSIEEMPLTSGDRTSRRASSRRSSMRSSSDDGSFSSDGSSSSSEEEEDDDDDDDDDEEDQSSTRSYESSLNSVSAGRNGTAADSNEPSDKDEDEEGPDASSWVLDPTYQGGGEESSGHRKERRNRR